jgi:hypothetical protein
LACRATSCLVLSLSCLCLCLCHCLRLLCVFLSSNIWIIMSFMKIDMNLEMARKGTSPFVSCLIIGSSLRFVFVLSKVMSAHPTSLTGVPEPLQVALPRLCLASSCLALPRLALFSSLCLRLVSFCLVLVVSCCVSLSCVVRGVVEYLVLTLQCQNIALSCLEF